ncbi:hypothetical protein [Tenacibaculum ovolyticum]|uniref:hypothetical protein n=1 Tax=Tenacibaculum ovolyticum TaxID=104270 RepID=UPI003BA99E99
MASKKEILMRLKATASFSLGGEVVSSSEAAILNIVQPFYITNANFMQKHVTTGTPVQGNTPATQPTVTFEEITEGIFGRQVFIMVDTQHMRGQNVTIELIRTDDGTNNVLSVTNGTADVASFSAIVGDTAALEDTTGNTPYGNLADFEDKAIFKIDIRPHTRTAFDDWAQQINIAPNPTIKLRVKPTDINLYVQYGDTDITTLNNSAIYPNGFIFGQYDIENKIAYEIYHGDNLFNTFPLLNNVRRRIGKIENGWSRVNNYSANDPKHNVTYFYFDHLDNTHEVCSVVRSRIVTVGARQNTIPPLASRGASIGNPISYVANQEAGATIDASELVMYQNGTHAKQYAKVTNPLPASVFTVNTNNIIKERWYPKSNQNNHSYLINMDIQAETGVGRQVFTALDYHDTVSGLRIRYGFRNTRRRYANPDVYAGFIGALAQFREGDFLIPRDGHNHFIVGEGFAYQDGSCFPSTNHRNGKAGDLYYLNTDVNYYDTTVNQYVNSVDIDTNSNYDYVNQEHLSNLFYDFGFSRGTGSRAGSISENFTNTSIGITQSTRLPHNRHLSTPAHDTHNHLENFQMNLVHSII